MIGIVLAAGRGSRLGALTDDSPKCLTPIFGKPLIHWQKAALLGAGLDALEMVGGYKADMLRSWTKTIHLNDRWNESSIVVSLLCAARSLERNDCIVSYSDIFYPVSTVMALKDSAEDIAITYDLNWRELWSARFDDPLADAETFRLSADNRVIEIGKSARDLSEIKGQFMGLLKFSPAGWRIVSDLTERMPKELRDRLDITALLSELIQAGVRIGAVASKGFWGEVDHESDIRLYESLLKEKNRSIEDLLGV